MTNIFLWHLQAFNQPANQLTDQHFFFISLLSSLFVAFSVLYYIELFFILSPLTRDVKIFRTATHSDEYQSHGDLSWDPRTSNGCPSIPVEVAVLKLKIFDCMVDCGVRGWKTLAISENIFRTRTRRRILYRSLPVMIPLCLPPLPNCGITRRESFSGHGEGVDSIFLFIFLFRPRFATSLIGLELRFYAFGAPRHVAFVTLNRSLISRVARFGISTFFVAVQTLLSHRVFYSSIETKCTNSWIIVVSRYLKTMNGKNNCSRKEISETSLNYFTYNLTKRTVKSPRLPFLEFIPNFGTIPMIGTFPFIFGISRNFGFFLSDWPIIQQIWRFLDKSGNSSELYPSEFRNFSRNCGKLG